MKVNCNIYRARLWLFNGCLEFLGAVSWAISAGLDVFENNFLNRNRKHINVAEANFLEF